MFLQFLELRLLAYARKKFLANRANDFNTMVRNQIAQFSGKHGFAPLGAP